MSRYRRRTVRCRYCYNSGHNQRSCPQMREEAAKNPNSWVARKVASYSTNVAEGGTARSCTYCRVTGHNRKTCSKLIQDFSADVKKCAEYRKNLLERMMACGFGVGALAESRYYGGDQSVRFIANINWMNITHLNHGNVVSFDEDHYSQYDLRLDKFNTETNTYEDYYYKLASGISPELVKEQMPDEWLSGRSPLLNEKYRIK